VSTLGSHGLGEKKDKEFSFTEEKMHLKRHWDNADAKNCCEARNFLFLGMNVGLL